MFDVDDYKLIRSEKDLKRAFPFPPAKIYLDSEIEYLNKDFKRFIALSAFAVMSSKGEEGIKVTPRGGSPGFIYVIDDHWLLIPDYKGNNKIETFKNLIHYPEVGLICFVSGIEFTLRITGKAYLTNDQTLLEKVSNNGRVPKIGTLIQVDKAYLHCGNSVRKSRIWESDSHFSKNDLPPVSGLLKNIIGEKGINVEAVDDYVESRLKESEKEVSSL